MAIMKTDIFSQKGMLATAACIFDKQETNLSGTLSILEAIKRMKERFGTITEIGKFEKIKIEVNSPLKDSIIEKSFLILEPSAIKGDFRTRVLSFVACSPYDSGVKRSVTQATGNKFAIDSVLKNRSTVSAFKEFIKESENFFLINRK